LDGLGAVRKLASKLPIGPYLAKEPTSYFSLFFFQFSL
jgi:hypothetical protein